MDISVLLRLREIWSAFCAAHPNFPLFLQAVRGSNVLAEGTVVEIIVTPAGQEPIRSKTRLGAEDVRNLRDLAQLVGMQ